ncbi:hypothetical protein KOY48_01275 [Candidatus Minimicrobia naudis]|uniref:Uncharacterized protein n=1 Tax=Candidatus Minimicrobia naudis TaxID=2841263 RepID=A0A8F1MDB2_9BACT|nr:hypothetical protein KOY48_01275 [Candidatus Minimicrobia naudis]
MAKRKYELPITSNVVMGIGLELGTDEGGIRPKETITEGTATESDTETLLSQREEARRNMTPEEQRTADEAAIRAIYEKYMKRAGDESLSLEDRENWNNAARELAATYKLYLITSILSFQLTLISL